MTTQHLSSLGKQAVHVVLIDDDEVDVEAVVRSFRLHGFSNPITTFRNGAEALQAMRGRFGRELGAVPFLVLLDNYWSIVEFPTSYGAPSAKFPSEPRA